VTLWGTLVVNEVKSTKICQINLLRQEGSYPYGLPSYVSIMGAKAAFQSENVDTVNDLVLSQKVQNASNLTSNCKGGLHSSFVDVQHYLSGSLIKMPEVHAGTHNANCVY